MVIEELKSFIDQAEKGRKYAPNSAVGIRVALGYFEKELNDEEKKSIEEFKKNFEGIYMSVVRNNQDKLSPASLEVYKRRVNGLLKDFEKYAKDPAKFVAWNPVRRKIIKKRNSSKKAVLDSSNEDRLDQDNINSSGMIKSEIPLSRQGVKAIIFFPEDLNVDDVEKIRLYIAYLSSFAKK